MTQIQTEQEVVGWQPYHLDHYAQELVIQNRDKENVLNESHKMRMSVAYGLERFWGEHLRLMRENKAKGEYWKAVWDKLAETLKDAGIEIPNDDVQSTLPDRTDEEKKRKKEDERKKVEQMARRIWNDLNPEQHKVALMVLTQFCDSLVWWTQRYKPSKK